MLFGLIATLIDLDLLGRYQKPLSIFRANEPTCKDDVTKKRNYFNKIQAWLRYL